MGALWDQVSDWGVVSIVSIGGTYLTLAKVMQRKYQTLIGAEIERVAQEKIHNLVDSRLDRMRKRLIYLSLLSDKTAKQAGISDEEIESLRRSCELGENASDKF